MNWRHLAAVAFVVLLATPTPAAAGFAGEPGLSVYAPENTVTPGEQTTLGLQVSNFGEVDPFRFPGEPALVPGTVQALQGQVKTARDVRITLRNGSAPVTVETGTRPLGLVPDESVVPVTFRVTVDEDARPGTYRLPVEVSYEWDKRVTNAGVVRAHDSETETVRVAIEVRPDATFRVTDVSTAVVGGTAGDLAVTVENTGTVPAREASVHLAPLGGGLTFEPAGSGNATRFVGRWNPGERRTLTYRVVAADSRTRQSYALAAQVSYRDRDGQPRASRPLTVGATPTPAPTFALEDAAVDLRVGTRGVVSGTVRNTGETAVREAVVVLSTDTGLRPVSTRYAVGTLEPDGTADVSYRVDVSERAAAGPEQVGLAVEYVADDETGRSDPLFARGAVAEEREPFALGAVNATFEPDTDGNRLVLAVTNRDDATRRDVVVELAPRPPFTSPSPAAYVGRLEPGETARVAFSVTVDEDAAEATNPIGVNVTSDGPLQTDAVDGPYVVPVTVREAPGSADDATLFAAAAAATLLVLAAGWWWLRQ